MGTLKNLKNMKKLLLLLLSAFFISCASIKEAPIQTIEKVIYKDSLIYVHDSISIKVPYEVIVETIAEVDTSYIKTTLAESIAYLDTTKRRIHHTLTQKGDLTIVYDTIIKTQSVDKIIEKEVPVEVEVIKYKRDALFWVLLGWAALCIIGVALKLYLKNLI